MIGIQFQIKNEYHTFLSQILKNVETGNCIWKIVEDEVIDHLGNSLFHKDTYSDIEFQNMIERSSYYVIFLNLQLYDQNAKIHPIQNYDDFIHSDCKLILLITDNVFVDIYAKEKQILEVIYENAIHHQFEEIRYIYDMNQVRKRLSAYSD